MSFTIGGQFASQLVLGSKKEPVRLSQIFNYISTGALVFWQLRIEEDRPPQLNT